MADFEIIIVGGGVVGLAVAERLSKTHPRLVLLEKNQKYGMETSSRNSEVIHAGIYYPPGSLRAKLCVEGRDMLYALCQKHGIQHRQITKLITAVTEDELPRLQALYENGQTNGVELVVLKKADALSMEPNIASVGAVYSPLTGIISVHALMDYFYHTTRANGGIVQHRAEVVGIERRAGEYTLTIREEGQDSTITSEIVINAAGLNADTVAGLTGIDIDAAGYRLHHAKGSYFAVVPSKASVVSRLVYPVPRNEGLGVHALIDWGGRLKFGPDIEYLKAGEPFDYTVSDAKRKAFGEAIRRVVPSLTDEDIVPDMSGIRPKLQPRGGAVRDFVIAHESARGLQGLVNLVGIDSPGLTASPAIARAVEQLLF
ncbi:MAG: NAD(P)/FAD-dependent oxidoreductase [Proteobacteria bacterium]|nr:NAD(P)/FAD-dependent oxidoreductase [Pseudomonadota bacterium]